MDRQGRECKARTGGRCPALPPGTSLSRSMCNEETVSRAGDGAGAEPAPNGGSGHGARATTGALGDWPVGVTLPRKERGLFRWPVMALPARRRASGPGFARAEGLGFGSGPQAAEGLGLGDAPSPTLAAFFHLPIPLGTDSCLAKAGGAAEPVSLVPRSSVPGRSAEATPTGRRTQ